MVFPSEPAPIVMVYVPVGKLELLNDKDTELVEEAPPEHGPVLMVVSGIFNDPGPVMVKSLPLEAIEEQDTNSEKEMLTILPPQTAFAKLNVGAVLSKICAVPPKVNVYPFELAEKLSIIKAKLCPAVTLIASIVGACVALYDKLPGDAGNTNPVFPNVAEKLHLMGVAVGIPEHPILVISYKAKS